MRRRPPLDPNDPILKPLRLGGNQFPGIWAYTMPFELRGLKLPQERQATCMNCPKACYEDFRADYRCCTYHPRIPNYLLGLGALGASGEQVIDLVAAKGMLLPEGMNHAPQQWYDYLEDLQKERFGKSQLTLCPMLDESNGFCRMHAFRNSVCSTFFCIKDHGDAGDSFWGNLQSLGSQVEMSLSQWCLAEIGFDLNRYFATFTRLSDEMDLVSGATGWQDYALEQLWGSWYGREKELILECGLVAAEHRHELWNIANTFEIRESAKFNNQMVRSVPERLQDQVDPDDLEEDEDAEAAKPKDLWKIVMKSYEKLWDLPDGYYILNPKVQIVQNARSDAEELFHEDKPFSVRMYTRKGGRTLDWRMFVSHEEQAVLQLFAGDGLSMDWRLLVDPALKTLGRGQEFLAEMLKTKVLIREALN